jgi:hypothetical protein
VEAVGESAAVGREGVGVARMVEEAPGRGTSSRATMLGAEGAGQRRNNPRRVEEDRRGRAHHGGGRGEARGRQLCCGVRDEAPVVGLLASGAVAGRARVDGWVPAKGGRGGVGQGGGHRTRRRRGLQTTGESRGVSSRSTNG